MLRISHLNRTRPTHDMLNAYVCRRKNLLLVILGILHLFAWVGIIYTIRNAQGGRNSREGPMVARANYDHFDTYVNYSGPKPLPRPIDLRSSFRFILNEPDTCSAERHPGMRILHYVLSAPQRFQQREFIRRAWGSPKFYSQFKMATVFFLGRTSNETLQALIEGESARFKDIIQADFPDEYYSLTYKAVFVLAWIAQFCSRTEYVVKTDDDVFVNPFRLMEMLAGNSTRDDAIHCSVYFNYAPHRNVQSKWFIRPREYPWRRYPDFCAGMAVYYVGQLVQQLYAATPHVPYVKFEDVYVTGMLRSYARIGIKHIGSDVNLYSRNNCLQKLPKPEAFCLMDSVASGEELWLQLMIMEVKERARKNEIDRKTYWEIFSDLLNRDFEYSDLKIKDL